MPGLLESARRHRVGLFTLAVLLLLAWIVWSARSALPPFIIGLALAFILDPVVSWLQRSGLPRLLGVIVAFAGVVAILWALIAFAVPPLARQATDFIDHLPQIGAAVADVENAVERWYRGLDLPTEMRSFLDQAIASGQSQVVELLQAIAGPTIGTLLRTVTFVFGLIVVPVWLFFVLKDRERVPGAVAAALPPAWRDDGLNILAILARVGGKWVRGELLLGVFVFAATAVGITILTLLGFSEFGQFTLVLALIAGVLEWFPVIGPIIAGVPMLLVGLSISPGAALAGVVVAVAVQQLENNLLVPKVMGDAVELHPAVLIVALVVGGALFGIGGAILAAPTVAIGRDVYRYTSRRLASATPTEALAQAIGVRGTGAEAAAREQSSSEPPSAGSEPLPEERKP
jgi:predicted PurR-regulated permease PerM